MKRTKLSYAMAALAAAALFGASAPFTKLLLGQDIAPIPLAALLYLGSGVSSILFRALLNRGRGQAQETRLSKADLPWLAGAIFAGGVAGPILLMLGLERTPAATAALLLNFETVSTTVIASIAFKEAVGKKVWGAVGVITLASVLLSWNGSGEWGFSAGAVAVLGACVMWGMDNNFTRNISAKDPLTIVIFKGLGAGVFSSLLAVIFNQPFPNLGACLLAMLLGAFSYGLSISLFILALRGMGASRTSALFSSAPFAGALIAFVLLREIPSLMFFPAIILMILGTWLLLAEDHEHSHFHEAVEHDHRHAHNDGHHTHFHPDGFHLTGEAHAHLHFHEACEHCHPHLPDIHHRHAHETVEA